MRISDWSSDVCSSDLGQLDIGAEKRENCTEIVVRAEGPRIVLDNELRAALTGECDESALTPRAAAAWMVRKLVVDAGGQIMLSDPADSVLLFGPSIPQACIGVSRRPCLSAAERLVGTEWVSTGGARCTT